MKLLLDQNIDQSCVYYIWPVSGVVDITSLKHPDDVCEDCFGKWINSVSRPFVFRATFEENGEVYIERCTPGASRNVFYLRRLHCYHPSNANFRRSLSYLCVLYVFQLGMIYFVGKRASVHVYHHSYSQP